MQNTILGGEGWLLGEKNEELGGKNEKGERKSEENSLNKYRGKRPQKCIFLVYKLQKFSRGSSRPLHPLAENSFVGEKNNRKEGGGGDRNAQYIPLFRFQS